MGMGLGQWPIPYSINKMIIKLKWGTRMLLRKRNEKLIYSVLAKTFDLRRYRIRDNKKNGIDLRFVEEFYNELVDTNIRKYVFMYSPTKNNIVSEGYTAIYYLYLPEDKTKIQPIIQEEYITNCNIANLLYENDIVFTKHKSKYIINYLKLKDTDEIEEKTLEIDLDEFDSYYDLYLNTLEKLDKLRIWTVPSYKDILVNELNKTEYRDKYLISAQVLKQLDLNVSKIAESHYQQKVIDWTFNNNKVLVNEVIDRVVSGELEHC